MIPQAQYQLTGAANASGVCTLTLPASLVIGAAQIAVGIVNVETDSSNITTAAILLNSLPVCSTPAGNSDTADGDPPIYVGAKDSFQVQWSGCDAADQCQAVVYYIPVDLPGASREQRGRRPTDTWQER